MIYFFVWRDIKIRYKQTVIGVAWALLQPFSYDAGFQSLFRQTGQNAFGGPALPGFLLLRSSSLVVLRECFAERNHRYCGTAEGDHKGIFSPIVLPVAAVISPLVDFAIGFTFLLLIMAWYHVRPALPMLLLTHLFLALAVFTALGVGLWLSALNAIYRDVRYVVPFLIQFWMFASPVAYASGLVPQRWRWVLTD